LQRNTYGSFAFEQSFKDLSFMFLLWLFIGTIIFTIISSVSIGKELSGLNLWLFKFSLFLSISCLLILPFSIQEILASTVPKRIIKESIKRLFVVLKKNAREHEGDPRNTVILMPEEEKQISKVNEIFLYALKNNDNDIIKLLLSMLVEYFSKENLHPASFNTILNIIISHLFDLFRENSISKRNEYALRMILKSLQDLRTMAKKLGTEAFELLDLNLDSFLRSILLDTTAEGLVSVSEAGFSFLEANLTDDLGKDLLFQKNVSESIKHNQEIYIKTNYLSTVNNIVERAIELERTDIIRRGFLSIQKISLPVAKDKNLDDYIRQKIVDESYLITKSLTLECVDKGIFKMVSEAIFHSFAITYHAFTKDAYYASLYDRALQYFLVTMIEIAKEDSIDINYWDEGLNIMWGISDECLYRLNDEYFLSALKLIITTFYDIKKVIESKKDKLDNEKTYSLIRLHLESILKTMIQKNLHNKDVEETISSILESFKKEE
jgi:hypothetical protein